MKRGRSFGPAAFLFILIAAGGGGAYSPLVTASLEAASLAVIAIAIYLTAFEPVPATEGAGALLAFAILALLLPLVQLIPLPYRVWSSLPGRALPAEIVTAASLGRPSMPLTLDIGATRAAAGALLPPIAVIAGTLITPPRDRPFLLRAIMLAAVLSALLGIGQTLAGADPTLFIWRIKTATSGSGLLVNSNHQADLMLLGMLASAANARVRPLKSFTATLGGRRRSLTIKPEWFIVVLLVIAVPSTASRAGLALMVPTIILVLATFTRRDRFVAIGLIVAVVSAIASVAVIATFPNALGAASRILGREARIDTLPDVVLALQTYQPWGSGMGTFVPVFNAAESLDNVGSRFFNHAHDDYLELLIEAGIGALLALVAFFAWLAWRWFRLERMPFGEKSHTSVQRLAIGAISILCVHSLLDYPLRTTTLLSIFALWGSLLALKRPFEDDRRRRSRR